MEDFHVANRIKETMDAFGMKASVASKAMKITRNTFYKKVHRKESSHYFTKENYNNLVDYIIKKSEELKKI